MNVKTVFRVSTRLLATVVTVSLVGCQLIIGLDDYELAPVCPVGAAFCTLCNSPADCPAVDVCHTWSCVQHLCQPIDAQPGTPCPTGVCGEDSPSTCVACNVDADCDVGAYCDGHACYRCDDGILNGDEVDIDCSGHCPTCTGLPCTDPSQCKSGFCIDGVCCGGPCTDVCESCNLEGLWGNCTTIAKFDTDPNTCFGNGKVCDGGNGCRLDNGATCVAGPDCASFKCENNVCVP